MKKSTRELKILVIVHGKTEKFFAQHIKSSLKIKMEILSNQKGNSSIQINGLKSFLKTRCLKTLRALKNEYPDLAKDFKIFIIMDLDDCDMGKQKTFQMGTLFKDLWFRDHIVPIWNNPNFEKPMEHLGIKVEHKKDYVKIFPIDTTNTTKIEDIKKLAIAINKCPHSNMDIFINYCLEVSNS